MTIEFQTPYGKVSEKLVNDIRNEVLKLSHKNKDILRAEVLLREDNTIITAENKVCEIRLTVYGDDLLTHARTEDFSKSAKEAIKIAKKLVNQQVKKQKRSSDGMPSSVKV